MSNKDFDRFVKELQKEIINKEINDFNERIVSLFHNPPNWGNPKNDKFLDSELYEGPCGDTMQFFLKIENDKIVKAYFFTDGCGASVAAGAQTTLLLEGMSVKEAEQLTPEHIDIALDGLPREHKHCAELSIRTLRKAIEKYNRNYKET